MNEPIITITGNLTADPALRFTGSGVPVANFTIANTPRHHNRCLLYTSDAADDIALV